MKRLLTILMPMALISSCYTPNKADRDLNKANEVYPEKVAAFAREKFPCKETGIDTVVRTEYDFIEIKCPDLPEQTTTIDTIYLTKPARPKTYILYKDKFVGLPTTTKIVTKIIRDSSCEILLRKCELSQQKYVGKNEKQAEWIKWLLIALGISVIGNILFAFSKR